MDFNRNPGPGVFFSFSLDITHGDNVQAIIVFWGLGKSCNCREISALCSDFYQGIRPRFRPFDPSPTIRHQFFKRKKIGVIGRHIGKSTLFPLIFFQRVGRNLQSL